MKSRMDKQLDQMRHKNPENWVGIFYVNKDDPRIFVPRKNQVMGWTINYGNRFTYVIIALFILLIIAYKMTV